MPISPASKEDSTALLEPVVAASADWRVASVEARPDFTLKVRFRDGLEGTVGMRDMIGSPTAGVFADLRDPALFAQASVEFGAVTWPGGLDLAPDAMYDEIKAHGQWVLR